MRALEEQLESTFPMAQGAWRPVFVDLMELRQHPALTDLVDYMIVHGERNPGQSPTGVHVHDVARWSTWSMIRGFVIGADIIAHHGARNGERSDDEESEAKERPR